MSLIGFHKVLITAAILFCGAFGVWRVASFARGGAWTDLALGLVFGIAAVALAVYLARLRQFLGRTGR